MIYSKKGVLVGKCSMITGGLVFGTLMVGGILSTSAVNADNDSVVDQVQITVSTSCTMNGVVNTAHTTSMQPDTYSGTNGIGKTTLTTHCNDNNGFSIYAVGFTNDTDGTNTLVGTTSSQTINTGIYSSGASDSSWSMKVSKVTDSSQSYNPQNMTIVNSFNNWHLVPTTYTKVAEYHAVTGSSATDTALGAKIETTYDAYISRTQTADTYTGKVKYVMVHPYDEEPPLSPQTPTAGCINYFANASDAVGTMGCQSATDNSSVTLLASNFSRTGYGFAGWSDKFDYATNPEAKFYGPQETITAPVGTTANGLSLYAVWVKSEGNLQDTNKVTALCGTNGTGGSLTAAPTDGTANLTSVSALTDQRDNNTYAIAKLADGKCWMIENLRLDNTAEFTLANTNNPLNDGTNVTLKHNYTDTDTFTNLSANSYVAYNADTAPGGWCTTNSSACDDQSRLRTDNTANRAANPTTNSGSMYSYGNYYNWYSATAGNGTYDFSTNNKSVAGDLCPAGWRLPIGGSSANASNSQFWQYGLAIMGSAPSNGRYYRNSDTNANGDTAAKALRKYPNNYLCSGYVNGGSLGNRGSSNGYYWSSTASSSGSAYYLYLDNSDVGLGTGSNYKYYGRAVRCIAQ